MLVLGAGVYQVPLIERARAMGLETIAVSVRGPYPGIKLADRFLEIDTRDVDGIVKAARELGISGIATTGTDVCVPAMGAVVDALGIAGTGYEAAVKSMDKARMKEAFAAHGVPSARFALVRSLADAEQAAKSIGYPLTVKAVDSSGSRGITRVCETAELAEAVDRAYGATRATEILVEQWLEGVEFGAQAFVRGGRVAEVFPHNDTVTPPPYSTPIGHSMPSDLSEQTTALSTEAIQRAVDALGIRDTVSNVDLMLVDEKPMILEIGARMGATCLPENVSTYAGFDVYEYVIRTAMGENPEINVVSQHPNAGLLLRSKSTGTVVRLEVPGDLTGHPDIVRFHLDVKCGDHVNEFTVGPDRIGDIVVKASSAREAEELAADLASQVVIEVQEE